MALTLLLAVRYLLVDGVEDLDRVHAVTEVVVAHVHGLFLDDLLAATVGLAWAEAIIAAVARVASFLIERLVDVGSPVFLLDDEVRRAAQVSVLSVVWVLLLIHKVRVLADVLQ